MPALKQDSGGTDNCKIDKNYFGYAHYNGADSGSAYSSVEASIEDYCEWVEDSRTEGTSRYEMNYTRGQEFAEVNNKFSGTPENNIYVLYSTYAYIGDTHICNDPGDVDMDTFKQYCSTNGNPDGTGGRYAIYYIYELGGLYTGEYRTRCGHKNGTDPTTIEEQADYAQYTVELRIKTAKTIFGEKAFKSYSTNGNILEACEAVMNDLLANNVHYSLDSNELCQTGIENTSDFATTPYCCCATYTSVVLYRAGVLPAEFINKYGFHGVYGINNMLNDAGWISIDSKEEVQPGDVCLWLGSGTNGHVFIYAGDGYIWDQRSGCIASDGTAPSGGPLPWWNSYKANDLHIWRMPTNEDEDI